jgi:V8-like Glu-specific endopeptidase
MLGFSRAKMNVSFAAAVASAGALSAGTPVAGIPAPLVTPTAAAFAGVSTAGPLFPNGIGQSHGCTASVVASPRHDLVLAAAHCVSGTAAGWQFAPGYDAGRTPYGVWTVTHAYVDPKWSDTQDPQHDYAILQVADQQVNGRRTAVQDVTGANVLGQAPHPGQPITDIAYNAGTGDQPIHCTTTVYYNDGFPAFNCHGYGDGSSGSPWLTTAPGSHQTYVEGIIAGLQEGGCYEYTSYSPAFTPDVFKLMARATSEAHPDTVPAAGPPTNPAPDQFPQAQPQCPADPSAQG